jgi:hypothetical protein
MRRVNIYLHLHFPIEILSKKNKKQKHHFIKEHRERNQTNLIKLVYT